MLGSEAWSVAIRIKLLDGFTTGLLGLSRHLGMANKEASALEKRLGSIQRLAMIGGGMTAAGLGILGALKPSLDEAKRFQQEKTKFSLYGMGDAANAEAVRFAKAMGIMGSSYVDNMKLINESQGVFRESGALNLQQQLVGAKIAAPILAKLNFINAGLSEDQRAAKHTENLAMLRFIEARGGANDPKTFASIADWGFKLSQSSGGIVPWSQLQRFAATSGVAGFNLTPDAIAKLEPVIADLKGGRVGSGLRVAFQRLLGTQRGLPKQAVSEFLSLGLWNRANVELSASGGIKSFIGQPGAVLKDRDLFATDPEGYFTTKFLPAIVAKYGPSILGDSVEARTKRAVEESLVFGPGTASAVFSQMDKLAPAIARSIAAQNKTLGIDAAYKAAGGTLAGKEVDLHAKLANLKELAGEGLLPVAIALLQAITPPLKGIADFGRAHPRLFGWLVDGVAALGAALLVGGVATSIVATFRALGLLASLFRAGGGAAAVAEKAPAIATGVRTLSAAIGGMGALDFIAIAGGVGVLAGAFGAVGVMLNRAAHQIELNTGKRFSWGSFLWDEVSGKTDRDALNAHRSPLVPSHPHGNRPVVVVKADKRGFMAWVADGLSHLTSGAHVGSSTFDPTMAQSIPGLVYHGGQ